MYKFRKGKNKMLVTLQIGIGISGTIPDLENFQNYFIIPKSIKALELSVKTQISFIIGVLTVRCRDMAEEDGVYKLFNLTIKAQCNGQIYTIWNDKVIISLGKEGLATSLENLALEIEAPLTRFAIAATLPLVDGDRS